MCQVDMKIYMIIFAEAKLEVFIWLIEGFDPFVRVI